MKARREFIVALGAGALALPFAGFAQQTAKSYRIGFLASEAASHPSQAKRLEVLKAALRELGYREGSDIVIEDRWADGRYDRLPGLASELVALKVSVIVASGTKAATAAENATTTIHIVMGSTGDPIGLGFTTNLARPSGNVTGTTNYGPELGPKLLEALKEAAPRTAKAAYLVNPADPPRTFPGMQSAAKALKFELRLVEARGPELFETAFLGMVKAHNDAVLVQGDTLFAVNVQTIAGLALKYRLASASSLNDFADAGGLITYGPDRLEGFRRAAVFVDKLLKGARPHDLPIERPTKLERVINLKTAKALGLASRGRFCCVRTG